MITHDNPEVTAVMITQNMERHRFVMMSIRSFLRQTYRNSRLLIVNDGSRIDIAHPRICEITLPFKPERTLGDLRNIALDHIETPLVIQWDDDDWSHPDRIDVQMDTHLPGKANILKHQIRFDILTGECRHFTKRRGIPGTIIHPLTERRYPSHRRGEDTVFMQDWRNSGSLNLIDNAPGLYVRLYTGNNTWERYRIMKGTPIMNPSPEVDLMLADLYDTTSPDAADGTFVH